MSKSEVIDIGEFATV